MADRDLYPKTLSRIKTARNRAGGNAAFAELVTKHRLEAGKETAMRADVLSGYLTGRSKRINDSTLAPIMAAVRETERAAYAARKTNVKAPREKKPAQPATPLSEAIPLKPAPVKGFDPSTVTSVTINGETYEGRADVLAYLIRSGR